MQQEFTVFVTGATGLIGKWTLAFLSRRHKVIALARNAASRSQSLNQWIDEHGGDSAQIQWVQGDLGEPALGLSEEDILALRACHYIYHMGAAFSWGLKPEYAHRITVDGTERLLRLAEDMPDLRGIVHLTGFMLASPPVWQAVGIEPQKYDPMIPLTETQIKTIYERFPGYEAAKFVAHFYMSHGAAVRGLPLTNIELASVGGHSETGELGQPHGIEIMIKALWERKLPVIPGKKGDWLPVIAIDFLAEFIARVIDHPVAQGRNIIMLDESSPDLKGMLNIFSRALRRKPPFLHFPIRFLDLILRSGGERLLGLTPEPLMLIHNYSYDTRPMKSLAQEMGLTLPDSQIMLERTAQWWQARYA